METTNDIVEARLKEQSSAVEHARWLATLCLAEMAGIVAYLDLEQRDLTFLWAVIIVVLGASLVLFIVTVILSRQNTKDLLEAFARAKGSIREAMAPNEKVALAEQKANAERLISAFEAGLSKQYDSGRKSETWAHIAFAAATAFAAVFLLLVELTSLIGDWVDRVL